VILAVGIAMAPIAVRSRDVAVVRLDGTAISSQQIDATVIRSMHEARIPGVGIAILNDSKIAYLKSYGLRDTARRLPLTVNTVMTAASLTKAAFAVMVMQLQERAALDLDRPVYRYIPKPLPEYESYRDLAVDLRYEQITTRMLLDHTSGLPNWRWLADEKKKLRIYFQPGSRFAYSGEGIRLAQMVVETISGKSLDELMLERIFRPLGMTSTSMVWEPRFEADFANGYDEQGRSLGPQRRHTPDAAGSMQTTLRDYARFLEAVMERRIPDEKSRALMLAPQIRITSAHEFPTLAVDTTEANAGIRLSYGLGWGLYWTPYGGTFFKEGHDDGWRHYAVCFDTRALCILIMTNSSNGEDIYRPLLETLIRDSYTPYDWEGFKK
jgi:CubicO group peptidase (beta-lactamase class C family)